MAPVDLSPSSTRCHRPLHLLRRVLSGTLFMVVALVTVLGGWFARAASDAGEHSRIGVQPMALMITSNAFAHNGEIPTQFTCDGKDISPELAWSGIPAGTKSLALIVDDPDAPDPAAPKMTWVHWVLYNIPPTAGGLPERVSATDLPPGTREGLNDWKRTGYGGPCPPIGRHRYFNKLYALDVVLPDLGRPTKAQLEQAMEGHILGHAKLIGTYKRHR